MEEQEAQTSSAGAMPLIWKRLWGLPIHPKFKVFAWKCFNGAVATNSALAARKISTDGLFVLYAAKWMNQSAIFFFSVSVHPKFGSYHPSV